MLKERIENLKSLCEGYDRESLISELFDLTSEYGFEHIVEDIIEESYINDMVKNRIESGDWQGVACMLAKIEYLNDDYYLINGYGNIEEITMDILKCYTNDLIRELVEIEEAEEDQE